MSDPSWNWMSPRPDARELAEASSQSPLRPCLPAVEQLGDRIMLSADVQPQAVVAPPPQVGQILIGMMKGDTDTFDDDLAALKVAASLDPKLGHRLTHALQKVDLAVYRLGKELIKGGPAPDFGVKIDFAKAAIDRQFLKIDAILARHPSDAQQKIAPALDALQSKAHDLVAQLAAVGPAPDLSKEDIQTLNKINLDWAQMTKVALKVEENVAFNKAVDPQFLKIKLSDVLISSSKIEDPTLKTELTNVVGSADQILIGLLVPGTGDAIGRSQVIHFGEPDLSPPVVIGTPREPDPADPCPACGMAVVTERGQAFLDLISQAPDDAAL